MIKKQRNPGKTRRPPVNIYGRVANFSARHAGVVIITYLILAAISIFTAFTSLEINTDPGNMIASDLPFRQHFNDYKRAFPLSDNTFLVVVEADTAKQAKQAGRAIVQSFRAQPKLFTGVYAPGLDPFFERNGILYLPEAEVTDIVHKVAASSGLISTLANQSNLAGLAQLVGQIVPAVEAGRAPDALSGFFTQASKTVLARVNNKTHPLDWTKIVTGGIGNEPKRWYITVKPELDFSKIEPAEAALKEARRIISDPENTNGGKVRVSLTGEAALNAEELQSVTEGAAIAGLVSFLLVTIIIWFGLPVARLIIPALGLLVLGFMINVGFATIAIGSLNMISVAFAVLFIGLGIDYAVHAVLRYWEERMNGKGRLAAITIGASNTGPALALCTLTTSLAFLAFVPSNFVGMAQLGIIAAGGIVIAFISSLTLIPAILSTIHISDDVIAYKTEKHNAHKLPKPVWQHLRLGTTVFTIFVAIAAVLLLPDVRFDGDPINLKDPKAPTVKAFKKVLVDEPGEAYAAQIIMPDADSAIQIAARLKQLPEVREVRWIDSFLPKRQQQKLLALHSLSGTLPTRVVTSNIDAETRQAALRSLQRDLQRIENAAGTNSALKQSAGQLRRTLLLLTDPVPATGKTLKMLERDLFMQLPGLLHQLALMSVAEPINADTMDSEVARRYITGDGRWRLEVIPKMDVSHEANLRRFVDSVKAVAENATGSPVEITGAAEVVSQSMILATMIALAMVLVVLIPVLRSPIDVALVLLPLILAGLLMLAYTVIFKSPFNFANVIVMPLLLGLGVDSAIHYVMRAREMHGKKHVVDTTTPRAVMISAFTTIGSFGTLWLSPHKGTSSMGELLTIAIIITLICTLIVLPQFIAWTIARHPVKK